MSGCTFGSPVLLLCFCAFQGFNYNNIKFLLAHYEKGNLSFIIFHDLAFPLSTKVTFSSLKSVLQFYVDDLECENSLVNLSISLKATR